MSADGITGPTEFGYDLIGRRVEIRAPAGQDHTRPTYTFSRDSLGRVVKTTEPSRGTITYRYDPAGNLATRTQASGSFTHSYDLIGRRIKTMDSDGRSRV